MLKPRENDFLTQILPPGPTLVKYNEGPGWEGTCQRNWNPAWGLNGDGKFSHLSKQHWLLRGAGNRKKGGRDHSAVPQLLPRHLLGKSESSVIEIFLRRYRNYFFALKFTYANQNFSNFGHLKLPSASLYSFQSMNWFILPPPFLPFWLLSKALPSLEKFTVFKILSSTFFYFLYCWADQKNWMDMASAWKDMESNI